jgi:uncharacterized protein YdhG (YjbR/CyaY superfamily)
MWQCPKCKREFQKENQNHFCGQIETVDDYIADQPAEVRPLLQSVRKTIRMAAPNATEKMAWRMPTFWQGENLIHFAAFKNHIGIFPGTEAIITFAHRLAAFNTTKSSIHLPLSKPIDHRLITDLVQYRLEQIANGPSIRSKPPARKRYPMPEFISAALEKNNLREQYDARPPYQQNDYIGWILRAKREETRQKRLTQMLTELQTGDAYMGMTYNAKTKK